MTMTIQVGNETYEIKQYSKYFRTAEGHMAAMKSCEEIAQQMVAQMPAEKKESLRNAISRNYILTSHDGLNWSTMRVYREGWYLVLEGTRSGCNIWAGDDDGAFRFGRKPAEDRLHLLYEISLGCPDYYLSYN